MREAEHDVGGRVEEAAVVVSPMLGRCVICRAVGPSSVAADRRILSIKPCTTAELLLRCDVGGLACARVTCWTEPEARAGVTQGSYTCSGNPTVKRLDS